MLVEFYDGAATELYNLASDTGEQNNVAAQFPQRIADLSTALAEWRRTVAAQTNRPNPGVDPLKFRELYEDVDASRFDPLRATDAQWETMQQWRKGMNSVPALKSTEKQQTEKKDRQKKKRTKE